MKRLPLLIVLMLLVLSLVACQSSTTPSGGDATAEPTQAATTDTAEPQPEPEEPEDNRYETPIHVSMNVMNAEKQGKHARNEYVKENFNLTFEYIPVSWGDWNEKLRTWIATDDAPDLIWWDLKGTATAEYRSYASQGAFRPILYEQLENRPNLKNVYDTSPSIPKLMVDGQLMTWCALRDNPPAADNCYTSHYCYRRDWAQAVGLYHENDIYTWDEWVELVRAVVREDPGNNGDANAGIVTSAKGILAPVINISAPLGNGNSSTAYVQMDGEWVWPPQTEEYKKSVVITYEMYQEGLIYPDIILWNGNEGDDMIKAGLAFANYNVTGSLQSWTTDMLRDGLIEKREDFGIAIVQPWDGVWNMTQVEDYWTTTAFNHKISDEAMERVLDFWEFLWTDEGILLRTYGIEGVDYNKIGDGLWDVELLWDYDEATGIYVSPYVNDEFGEANGALCGRTNRGPGREEYRLSEVDRLWSTYASGVIPTETRRLLWDVDYNSELVDEVGNFVEEVKEKILIIVAQKGIDPAAEWDAYVESMMPRVQPVLDDLNNR